MYVCIFVYTHMYMYKSDTVPIRRRQKSASDTVLLLLNNGTVSLAKFVNRKNVCMYVYM